MTANLRIAFRSGFVALCMFAFGYAMVPLYEKFCEVTGIYNILEPATDIEDIQVDISRAIRMEFITTAVGKLAITPNLRAEQFTPGRTYSVIYTLENLSDKTLLGQAIPSFSPARAGNWVKKIQCFCFEQLSLAANETIEAPVVFILSDEIPKEVETLALSYTFFEIEGGSGGQ